MCTTQDAPTLLPLFLNGITQFAISKTVFDEYKAQHIKAIQRVPEDWFESSLNQLKTAVMPPQYMARYPLKGTEATVSTLEPDHVEAYIQTLLNTAPITVAITAQDAGPFLSVIDTAFQALPERVVNPLPTMPRVASATVNATISQPNGVVLSVVPIKPITTITQWLTMQGQDPNPDLF